MQQCGSGIPQSSGTLEPPAAFPLPLFLLHCPATLPNRLLHRGNRLVEDRRAWATREEDEPVGVRCNKTRFDAPQGFPLSLNHNHCAPDPPQWDHKRKYEAGRDWALSRGRVDLHQSPRDGVFTELQSKMKYEAPEDSALKKWGKTRILSPNKLQTVMLRKTFVLHSMSRTRRVAAQFLAISCKEPVQSLAFDFNHHSATPPLSTGQSNQTGGWTERDVACRPSQQESLFYKRNFQILYLTGSDMSITWRGQACIRRMQGQGSTGEYWAPGVGCRIDGSSPYQ